MDLAAELAQFKPEPALAEWLGKLLEKTKNDALKIQALTFSSSWLGTFPERGWHRMALLALAMHDQGRADPRMRNAVAARATTASAV